MMNPHGAMVLPTGIDPLADPSCAAQTRIYPSPTLSWPQPQNFGPANPNVAQTATNSPNAPLAPMIADPLADPLADPAPSHAAPQPPTSATSPLPADLPAGGGVPGGAGVTGTLGGATTGPPTYPPYKQTYPVSPGTEDALFSDEELHDGGARNVAAGAAMGIGCTIFLLVGLVVVLVGAVVGAVFLKKSMRDREEAARQLQQAGGGGVALGTTMPSGTPGAAPAPGGMWGTPAFLATAPAHSPGQGGPGQGGTSPRSTAPAAGGAAPAAGGLPLPAAPGGLRPLGPSPKGGGVLTPPNAGGAGRRPAGGAGRRPSGQAPQSGGIPSGGGGGPPAGMQPGFGAGMSNAQLQDAMLIAWLDSMLDQIDQGVILDQAQLQQMQLAFLQSRVVDPAARHPDVQTNWVGIEARYLAFQAMNSIPSAGRPQPQPFTPPGSPGSGGLTSPAAAGGAGEDDDPALAAALAASLADQGGATDPGPPAPHVPGANGALIAVQESEYQDSLAIDQAKNQAKDAKQAAIDAAAAAKEQAKADRIEERRQKASSIAKPPTTGGKTVIVAFPGGGTVKLVFDESSATLQQLYDRLEVFDHIEADGSLKDEPDPENLSAFVEQIPPVFKVVTTFPPKTDYGASDQPIPRAYQTLTDLGLINARVTLVQVEDETGKIAEDVADPGVDVGATATPSTSSPSASSDGVKNLPS